MKYEVMKQAEEINHAIAVFDYLTDPTMKNPSEEEMRMAIKKAASCMTLMVRMLCDKDMTMRDLNNELREEKSSVYNDDVQYEDEGICL